MPLQPDLVACRLLLLAAIDAKPATIATNDAIIAAANATNAAIIAAAIATKRLLRLLWTHAVPGLPLGAVGSLVDEVAAQHLVRVGVRVRMIGTGFGFGFGFGLGLG